MTIFLSRTGFDSDNSSGEFSEANQKVTGMIDLDTSKNNRIGKIGERPSQENGIQKHRYVLSRLSFLKCVCNHPKNTLQGTPQPSRALSWSGTPHSCLASPSGQPPVSGQQGFRETPCLSWLLESTDGNFLSSAFPHLTNASVPLPALRSCCERIWGDTGFDRAWQIVHGVLIIRPLADFLQICLLFHGRPSSSSVSAEFYCSVFSSDPYRTRRV